MFSQTNCSNLTPALTNGLLVGIVGDHAVSPPPAVGRRGAREPQVFLQKHPVGSRRRHHEITAPTLLAAPDALRVQGKVRAEINQRHFGALGAHSRDEHIVYPEKVCSQR